MFGAIIGWLRVHLGLKTEAASPTGSLHAKLTNVIGSFTALFAKNIVTNDSVIKSIQTVSLSLSSSGLSRNTRTVSISPVNRYKSVIVPAGNTGSTNPETGEIPLVSNNSSFVRYTLGTVSGNNYTTITATRNDTSSPSAITCEAQIIEFY